MILGKRTWSWLLRNDYSYQLQQETNAQWTKTDINENARQQIYLYIFEAVLLLEDRNNGSLLYWFVSNS